MPRQHTGDSKIDKVITTLKILGNRQKLGTNRRTGTLVVEGDVCITGNTVDIVTDAWHEKVQKFFCDLCRSDDDAT